MFRHVEALASFLMERGHRIHLAYSDVRGSDRLTQLVAKVSASGGKTVNLAVSNAPGPGDVAALLKLRRLVAEARPDVIHAHSSKAGALARALVGLGVRQPVFYTPHAYYGLSGKGGMKSWVFNAVEMLFGHVGTTINLSEGERAFARNSLKISQSRLRLIANPVDCLRFRPADAQKRWGDRIVLIRRENSLEPIADTTLGRWLSDEFKQRNPARWRQIRETVAACTPSGYIGCAAAIQNFKWTDQLSKIVAPTYVLCGEDDPGANPEETRMIAQTVQNGAFLAIPKARHLPNIEDPDGFNKIVIDWCKRHN